MTSYAEYIRILGRGPTKSRNLTRDEARVAFDGVLSGEMADIQVGALLLLLRYRGENPAELAGIVEAMRDHSGMTGIKTRDIIDWPSYSSGRSRRLPWFLLSAKLLADNGVKVFMHGFNSHLDNGLLTESGLAAIGVSPSGSLSEAQRRLDRDNFAYLPLRHFCPKLMELLQIREMLGVRSVVNTAVKLINPLGARLTFLGIFHPAYITLNTEAARLLDQPALGVIKGGGGEAERNILKSIRLFEMTQGVERHSQWAAMATSNVDYPVTADYLRAVWRGVVDNDYATAMIVGTAAMALYLIGRASDAAEAEQMAWDYWHQRLMNGE